MFKRVKQNLSKKALHDSVLFIQGLFDTNFIKEIPLMEIGERPSWSESNMLEAYDIASRATCYHVNSGSAIIFNKRLIGKGYNGAAPGIESCLEKGFCYKEHVTGKKYGETMNLGLCRGVHSEKNALFNMLTRPPKEREATLYTTIFPCNTCAKDLIASRVIGDIVFANFYDLREFKQTIAQFNEVGIGISYLRFTPERLFDISLNRRKSTFDLWDDDERKRIGKVMKVLQPSN